jgi:hypothetical protein
MVESALSWRLAAIGFPSAVKTLRIFHWAETFVADTSTKI